MTNNTNTLKCYSAKILRFALNLTGAEGLKNIKIYQPKSQRDLGFTYILVGDVQAAVSMELFQALAVGSSEITMDATDLEEAPEYRLVKKETARKTAKFTYEVIDRLGNVISTRNSDRHYEAATISGGHYFGRRDLVGKGDHGNAIKMAQGWGRTYTTGGWIWEKKNPLDQEMLDRVSAVAYLIN